VARGVGEDVGEDVSEGVGEGVGVARGGGGAPLPPPPQAAKVTVNPTNERTRMRTLTSGRVDARSMLVFASPTIRLRLRIMRRSALYVPAQTR
jgi:hypothetical protein